MKKNWLVKLFTLIITIIIVSSCGEKWLDSHIDDEIQHEIQKDKTAQFININVGMEAEECYDSIQKLKEMDSIAYLFVVDNYFYSAEDIDSVIELYNDLYIDSENGTTYGVQINYREDTVKSMYLNSGDPLLWWPVSDKTENSIELGDSINTIYSKIVELEDEDIYTDIVYRTWNKNLDKPYDENMGELDLWYCTRKVGDIIQEIDFYYNSGVLDSIVRYEFIPFAD
ncbi:hypothetical protein ACFLTE_01225 [Bacteroidota bacterium]